LLDDLREARTCLETVLTSQTPMDSVGNRYCWARRAELELAHGNSALALEITERLIASAPGMSPGRVITFLWGQLRANFSLKAHRSLRLPPCLLASSQGSGGYSSVAIVERS